MTTNINNRLVEAQNISSSQRIQIKELNRKLNKRRGLYAENVRLKVDINALDSLIEHYFTGDLNDDDFYRLWKTIIKEKLDEKEVWR